MFKIYREDNGEYFPVDMMEDSSVPLPATVPFTAHAKYGKRVKAGEDKYTLVCLYHCTTATTTTATTITTTIPSIYVYYYYYYYYCCCYCYYYYYYYSG